jgi:plastocyanin
MRKLNGLIFISALIMVCSVASAQMQIIIDNQEIPTEHIQSITILPNTNVLSVVTTVDYDITATSVVDGVAINSFTRSSATVVAGQTVTFNWATSNADNCDAIDGVDGWAANNVSLNGSRTITTATVGLHTYRLTCSDANNSVTKAIGVETTTANAVAITFTAVPNAITEGEATTLSWSAVNATSCTATGGTADWIALNPLAASGNANIVIDSAGPYSFDLTCQNADDQKAVSASVIVSPEVQVCDPPLAGNTVGWGTFWSEGFPAPVYENVTNWIIPQKGYLAIEFNTANINDDGKISALENSSSPGIRNGSVSTCPGDFDVPADCHYQWGLGGGLRWATNGKSRACPLDSNTTYYFNITFTNGADINSSTCNSTPCRINLQHSNF